MLEIYFDRNRVEIEKVIIHRPSHVSVMQWLEFWEEVDNISISKQEHDSLIARIQELEEEVKDLEDEIEDLKDQLDD